MKVLILVSCFLAAASAGVLHGAHLPVFDHNGYQIDTADVAAAKSAHFAAHAEVNARLGHVAVAPVATYAAAAPLVAAPYAHAYAGPIHVPVIGKNGVPVDTPEVAAGKVANAVAHAEAHARNGDFIAPVATYAHGYAAPLAYAHGYAAPVIAANGVPLDTPEVVHAKAAHFAAHVEAKARNGVLHPFVHYRKRRGVVAPLAYTAPLAYSAPVAVAHSYAGPQHIPVIGPNGVPLDTPEVAAGKAANAAAHVEAHARNGDYAVVAPAVAPVAAYAAAAPVVAAPYVAAPFVKSYTGPQHIPVIGPNGVPLDTPEVAAGKVANAAAHVEAKARNGDLAVVAPAVATYAHGYAAPLAYSHGYSAPLAYTHGYSAPLAYATPYAPYSYAGPQHIPVIGPNGVPLDTPEVAAGKVANAAAHVEAKARNGDLVYHY